jgi:hypothetical protein
VASGRLKFITFTKILTRTVRADFTTKITRQSDSRDVTVSFKKGETWSYLAYGSEGTFRFKFRNTVYQGNIDMVDRLAAGGFENLQTSCDEWSGLTCANGTTGWILFREVHELPGFGPVENLG